MSRSLYQAFQHPSLSEQVLIKGTLSLEQFRSLLCWVRVHAPVIRVVKFVDCSKAYQDTVLGALTPLPIPGQGLTTFHANQPSQMALNLLPSFTRLTTCTLLSQQGGHIDLTSLQLLPSLHVLALMGPGGFVHLYMLPHLTRLHLLDTVITPYRDPPFRSLSTIKQLDLSGAQLHGLADRGLGACEGLQVLRCNDSYVEAAERKDNFSMPGRVHTAAMTSLNQLTELQLCYSVTCWQGSAVAPAELRWVCQLTALQKLVLDACGPGCICANLTCLSKLTALDLGGRWRGDSKLSQWDVSLVDWTKMVALKTMSVVRCAFKASSSSRLMGLCQLPHLQKICLIECKPANEISAASIVGLQRRLSSHRPDVALILQAHWVRGHQV